MIMELYISNPESRGVAYITGIMIHGSRFIAKADLVGLWKVIDSSHQ